MIWKSTVYLGDDHEIEIHGHYDDGDETFRASNIDDDVILEASHRFAKAENKPYWWEKA